MIVPRPGRERGRTKTGWLDSHHTFAFNDYFDPEYVSFRSLRVMNEDYVIPGAGFGTHGHRDMEILSYVLEGALEHKDSSGGGGVIRPGEVQFMRAGTGVTHSERNASGTEPVHFLQIWIVPDTRGLAPAYGQKAFDPALAGKGFVLLASKDGRAGSLSVHQDADLYVTRLAEGEARSHPLGPGRHAWVQVTRGAARVGTQALKAGDGAAFSEEPQVELEGVADAEVLLFDLA
jgi:quercetin 2,3-dioxygenase